MHDWVHESRIVVLAKKRKRLKTQRLSGEGTAVPRTKRARPSHPESKATRVSMPAGTGRRKQTPRAATRQSFPGRKTVLRKNAASESFRSEIISVHSDSDSDEQDYRRDKTGKDEENPIDLCSDYGQKEQDHVQDATKATSADPFLDDALSEEASCSSLDTQDFVSQDEAVYTPTSVGRRKKLVARKTAYRSKAANTPVARMPAVFPSKVNNCPVARMPTVSPPNVDDCPVATMHTVSPSKIEDGLVARMPAVFPSKVDTCPVDVAKMPATKSGSDRPLIEPEALDSSAESNGEAPARRRVRTEFYQPEQPLKSTPKRLSPALSHKDAISTSTHNSVDKRRTALRGGKKKAKAILQKKRTTPTVRWTAKSLRNVNRYILDADKYPE